MTGPRILVVDDEQQILRALRTTLRAAGYEVETADTAQGALAAAAMRPPEAVILDLVLPDGSGIDELLARLRAALRRAGPSGEPVLAVGELEVDLERRVVRMSGAPVHLTPHEFDLLRFLARNEGKLLTHRMLLQELWGPGYGDATNILHVNVSQLRRKLEPDPSRPRYLLTEAGVGYRLVDPQSRS